MLWKKVIVNFAGSSKNNGGSGRRAKALAAIALVLTSATIATAATAASTAAGNQGSPSSLLLTQQPVPALAASAADAECENTAVSKITAKGNEEGNTPKNVLDNSLKTRWSNYGIGSWIKADLGSLKSLCSIDIAWYRGDERTNSFKIELSADGSSYYTAYSGKSSGRTLAAEKYALEEGKAAARYVRVTVNGNTQNSWASITEIDAYGHAPPPPDASAPTVRISSPVADSILAQEDTKVTVSGTASDNPGGSGVKAVEVRVNDGDYLLATPKAAGDWSSWTVTVDTRTEGTHRLVPRATDNAGNKAWNSIYVAVDTMQPGEDDELDRFGIKKIYPTKAGGNEWYVNMDDPDSDSLFRNLPSSIKKQPDGSWQVSADQVRLEAWSPENEKWLNVEITAYAKVVGGTNELLQMYSRGGHHTTKDPCLGSAYKARLYGDGEAAWVKEVVHPAYAGNRGSMQATDTPLEGRWIGFKAVIYNVEENGGTYVRLESYIDDVTDAAGNLVIKNDWKLASVVEDRGGWSTKDSDFDSSCGKSRDEVLTQPGGTETQNIAAWRSDDLTWNWKYLSAREVAVPAS